MQIVLQVAAAVAADGLHGGAQRLDSVARIALCLVIDLHLDQGRSPCQTYDASLNALRQLLT